jgi:hypothetical protein
MAGAYDDAIKLLEPQAANPATPPALRQNLAEAYAMAGMDADAERMLKMDLPPEQVKKKLAHYHALRAKSATSPPYAMLGSFTTSGFAQARLDTIKQQFSKETESLTLEIESRPEGEGETPVFYTRARGFKNSADMKVFCEILKKGGAFCKPATVKDASPPSPPTP